MASTPCAGVSNEASIDGRIDAITDVSIDDINDGGTDATWCDFSCAPHMSGLLGGCLG